MGAALRVKRWFKNIATSMEDGWHCSFEINCNMQKLVFDTSLINSIRVLVNGESILPESDINSLRRFVELSGSSSLIQFNGDGLSINIRGIYSVDNHYSVEVVSREKGYVPMYYREK